MCQGVKCEGGACGGVTGCEGDGGNGYEGCIVVYCVCEGSCEGNVCVHGRRIMTVHVAIKLLIHVLYI